MSFLKIIFCFLLTFFYSFYYSQINALENNIKNIYFCLQDSIDYDENTSRIIKEIISKDEDEKVLICFSEDEKLKQILIKVNRLDTLDNIYPTWTNIYSYNKDFIFEFLLIFENFLNKKINTKININLILSSNNFSKYVSNNHRIILNEVWNNICLISAVSNNLIVKKVYLLDLNNSINDNLSIKKLEDQFLSQIIIPNL